MEKLSQKSIIELQGRKLRAMFRHRLFNCHPFYRELFKRSGICLNDVTGVEDLGRLPFTTRNDLCQSPESFIVLRSARAAGSMSAIAGSMRYLLYDTVIGNRKIKMVDEYDPVMTFDTIGHGCPVYLSGYDLEIFKELCSRGAMCAGLGQRDSLMNVHPYGQRLDFWQAHYASLMLRSFTSRTGQAAPLDVIKAARRIGATAMTGNAYYLYYLARAAVKAKEDMSKLRTVMLTGYGVDDVKKKLEGMFGEMGISPRIVGMYSITEARQSFPECPDGTGFHTYPDIHIWECIDHKTGEAVGPGEKGELVFTSIEGRGSMLLRYRTGDIAEGGIVYEPCAACGRTAPRIIGPLKKMESEPVSGVKAVSKKLLDIDGILYASARRKDELISISGMLDGSETEETVRDRISSACGEHVAVRLDRP
jgi:phenylacetate-coenzyme A ligase PaaK-like adenylate-forming protein